jgi:integrase
MVGYQLPTSRHVATERTPPEVEEVSLLLNEAVAVIPDVAPLLALGAVTGMRRGELVGLRRSRIIWNEQRLVVDTAIDASKRVKGTKTRQERSVHVDAATIEMLRRHLDQMDARAAEFGTTVETDGFAFSLEPGCATPMPPDFVTKRVAVLKDHLGIATKKPETIYLEDEALELYRQPPSARPAGVTGPAPKGGMSFREIGEQLGRSEKWAMLAVASAERREAAIARGLDLNFDGSILALRKFTSSELLDSGFNISMVAQRQGHGPQVLIKHYSKGRRSADRRAAEHLGRVVHGTAD